MIWSNLVFLIRWRCIWITQCQRLRFWKRAGLLVLIGLVLGSGFLILLASKNHFESTSGVEISASLNYFLSQTSFDSLKFIVNTSGCKILDLNAWDPSILHLLNKNHSSSTTKPKCSLKIPHWTYVDGSNIVINASALHESGYTFDSLQCCYQTIERIDQPSAHYNDRADELVRYSLDCSPMGLVTTSKSEYVHVICTTEYFDQVHKVYQNFHILALPTIDRVQRTIKYWKEFSTENLRPPNVILLGIDSTSRINFQRNMPETKQILQEIGAHEMLGYTKVGDNTYPNIVAAMTGYDSKELERVCRDEQYTKLDDCPFIWKNFKDAGYLTAEIEDCPTLGMFNLFKTGFVVKPTDFYSRPLMLAAYRDVGPYPHALPCLGYKTVDEFLLNYAGDAIQVANSNGAPIFLLTWLTQLTHDDTNALQSADEHYAKFLQGLIDTGAMANSFLIVMSDHGYRYGKFRNTFSGWYEDKLPNLWFHLPPKIRQNFPEWENALAFNTRQLSSPFDLYHTLADLFQSFSNGLQIKDSVNSYGNSVPRNHGQSFLRPIPANRTCSSAGIPSDYCACQYPVQVPKDDQILKQAGLAAVLQINNKLSQQCVKFALSTIEGGALLQSSGLDNEEYPKKYIISFKTKPGDFLFETSVELYKGGTLRVSDIVQRMSKINTDVSCVRESTQKLFCYCDTQST